MSRLPFELQLALRYLRPKRTFVSIITLISVIGVMLGVGVLIIVISVMTGFHHDLQEAILGFNAHLQVMEQDGALKDHRPVQDKIQKQPYVKAAAPFIGGKVMFETQPEFGDPRQDACFVRGIDPRSETNVSKLPSKVEFGEFNVRGDGLLVGIDWAQNNRVRVGDRISIYSPANLKEMQKTREEGEDVLITPDEFTINGIFDLGYYEYNSEMIVMSLMNAQDLFDVGDDVQGVIVMIDDPYEAHWKAMEMRKAMGTNYVVQTWMQRNSRHLQAVMVEKNVMFIILVFIMIVASFCIVCTQITFVVQKTREIGVLKSLGASDGQIRMLFFGQSFAVGIIGVICGVIFGLTAVHFRNQFLELMRKLTGAELFPAEIYGFYGLPAKIVTGDVVLICGVSLLICLMASLIPAIRASTLQPVEALRNE